tara:strand:+ start:292 stop:858 length:567 start_codon:yes stop_codon:yes gene_type:complete
MSKSAKLLVDPADFRDTNNKLRDVLFLSLIVIFGLAIHFSVHFWRDARLLHSILELDVLAGRVETLSLLSPSTLPYFAASIVLFPFYFISVLGVFLACYRFKDWEPQFEVASGRKATAILILGTIAMTPSTFLMSLIGSSGVPLTFSFAFNWPFFLILYSGSVFLLAICTFQLIGWFILMKRKVLNGK